MICEVRMFDTQILLKISTEKYFEFSLVINVNFFSAAKTHIRVIYFYPIAAWVNDISIN